jgi:hypothetical protein
MCRSKIKAEAQGDTQCKKWEDIPAAMQRFHFTDRQGKVHYPYQDHTWTDRFDRRMALWRHGMDPDTNPDPLARMTVLPCSDYHTSPGVVQGLVPGPTCEANAAASLCAKRATCSAPHQPIDQQCTQTTRTRVQQVPVCLQRAPPTWATYLPRCQRC